MVAEAAARTACRELCVSYDGKTNDKVDNGMLRPETGAAASVRGHRGKKKGGGGRESLF